MKEEDGREYRTIKRYYERYKVAIRYISGHTEIIEFVEDHISKKGFDRKDPSIFDELKFVTLRDYDPSSFEYGSKFEGESVRKLNTVAIEEYEVLERKQYRVTYETSYILEESKGLVMAKDRQLENEPAIEKIAEHTYDPKRIEVE